MNTNISLKFNWKILYKYLTNKKVTIKFCNKCIYIHGPLGFLLKKIIFNNNNNFYTFNNLYLIINNKLFSLFLKDLNKLIIGVIFGWYLVLNIAGRGFNFKIKKQKDSFFLKLKIGYSHYIYYQLPYDFWVKTSKKKTKLFIFNLNFWKLMKLGYQIRNLRSKHTYKIQGISFYNESIIIKPGKKQLL